MTTLAAAEPAQRSRPVVAETSRGGGPRVLMIIENESVPSDRRVWAIARSLTAVGCDVTVVCPMGDASLRAAGERDRFEELEGISVHRYPPRFATGGLLDYAREYGVALWRTRRVVRALSRRHRFDVVHIVAPPDFMVLAGLRARRGGAALILDHHDLTPELVLTRFGKHRRALRRVAVWIERLSLRTVDVVLATNDSYAAIACSRGARSPQDVFVVRNAPDLRHFRPAEATPELKRGKKALISYVGVMGAQDGVDHALRALALLRERRTDWHAIFAGEGDARPELQRLARELGLDEDVEFVGWLDDEHIAKLLSTSDVSLSPEPKTPLNDVSTMVKLAEYMSMSCPIVAFDLTESRATAGDAAVYATPNRVAEYSEAIGELLSDARRRQSMGAIGRARVETWLSWENSEQSLFAGYMRALELIGSPRTALLTPRSP